MNEVLSLDIGGIRCDNPVCNYKDDSVKVEEYNSWLNKPCPLCSANLLTEADYHQIKKMMAITKFINSMKPEELSLFGYKENDKRVMGSIEMNGTGTIDLQIIE